MSTPPLSTEVPGYRSRFGGFWADRLDAPSVLKQKLESGAVAVDQAELFQHWIDEGFVLLPAALSPAAVDEVNREVDKAWQGEFSKLFCEYRLDNTFYRQPVRPAMRGMRTKLLDLYSQSAPTRDAFFVKPLFDFLSALFERPPMVFQSLYFERGSEQRMHQDSAFVRVGSPMDFVGVWVALEDIQPGSGELEYYSGSHKLPEFIWDNHSKNMPMSYWQTPAHHQYLDSLHANSQAAGLRRVQHRPRKGDILVWHADLAHGGSPHTNTDLTRKSFAVHICPHDAAPEYFTTTGFTGPLAHASGGKYAYEHHLRAPATYWDRVASRIRQFATAKS
jgi:hypothetical protein